MDCLMKTVRSEGYFGMYRGETRAWALWLRACRFTKFVIKTAGE